MIKLLGVDARGNKIEVESVSEEGDEGEDGSEEEAIKSEDKDGDEPEGASIWDRAARLGVASMRAAKATEDRASSRSGSSEQETPSRRTAGSKQAVFGKNAPKKGRGS